jgi:hypothetical protein
MIARRLPFDNRDVPELLRTIKEGSYVLDDKEIEWEDERELIRESLRKDPSERITVSLSTSLSLALFYRWD